MQVRQENHDAFLTEEEAPCSEVLMALGRQAAHSPGVSPHLDVAWQLQQEGGTRGDASAVHRQVAHPAVRAGQAACPCRVGLLQAVQP